MQAIQKSSCPVACYTCYNLAGCVLVHVRSPNHFLARTIEETVYE